MRRLMADLVFPVTAPEIEQGILVLNSNQTIATVLKPGDSGYDPSAAERLDGWLVPGFVNAHCHLELSHLKSKLNEQTGLDGFVEELMHTRQADESDIQEAIASADNELYQNGTELVGDISNGSTSFAVKAESPIRYFTFIERFGFNPAKAEPAFQTGLAVLEKLRAIPRNNVGNLTPHAPYSVSEKLFRLIADHISAEKGIFSIHNQETASENELFRFGKGLMFERLIRMRILPADFSPSGKTSLASMLDFLPENCNIQLVHNTFITVEDLDQLTDLKNRIYLCLCPGANLFIENRLPDIPLFVEKGFRMTIGTDSLASNHQLSILEELRLIQNSYPGIPVSTLFSWATLSGATLFGHEKMLGSFDPGKKPGVLLIQGSDSKAKIILPGSRIHRC